MTSKYYIVGNWKMNQTLQDIEQFYEELGELSLSQNCQAWIAPQAIHIPYLLKKSKSSNIKVGSQNISDHDSGAFTGEISPSSLKDLGASFTLVGHSERRALYNEGHDFLNKKTQLALSVGLKVIFCCGESLEEREAGKTQSVVAHQLREGLKDIPTDKRSDIIIAYEPVWAIGTGKTASPEQAEEVHLFIRNEIKEQWGAETAENMALLYGGSVKPANASGLLNMANINGALVGGASLKGSDFKSLCDASPDK